MPDALACERLLRRLSINRPHEAINLCAQVLGQCRRGQIQDAIRTAESALRLARADYAVAGIVLLYLSYARLSSRLDDQITLMSQDADRAIRLLSLDPFNQAIAYVFRANLELERKNQSDDPIGEDDLSRKPQALVYLHRANDLLQPFIRSEREHNQPKQVLRGSVLQAMVCQRIAELETLLNADDDMIGADTPRSQTRPPYRIVRPVRLIWPVPEPAVKIEIQSIGQGFVSDSLESHRLTIADKSYRVLRSTSAGLSAGSIRLRPQQVYWVMPLSNDAENRRAIVRRRVRPDRDQQLVAYYDNATDSVLIDQAESSAPYTHIRIVDSGRDWLIAENADHDPIYIGGPYMIGVVEAFLIPE